MYGKRDYNKQGNIHKWGCFFRVKKHKQAFQIIMHHNLLFNKPTSFNLNSQTPVSKSVNRNLPNHTGFVSINKLQYFQKHKTKVNLLMPSLKGIRTSERIHADFFSTNEI